MVANPVQHPASVIATERAIAKPMTAQRIKKNCHTIAANTVRHKVPKANPMKLKTGITAKQVKVVPAINCNGWLVPYWRKDLTLEMTSSYLSPEYLE